MAFSTRQKLVVFIGDDREMRAAWITVPMIEEMLRDGTMVECEITDTQAATVIHAAATTLAKKGQAIG